jgi:hypothetical protein
VRASAPAALSIRVRALALGLAVACGAWASPAGAARGGTEYHVGPGQRLARLGDVPWYALQAGDTVYVHHRPEPYREKILISGRGTPERWIRVLGVPGPNGELPVISGDGATTSRNMHHRWQDPAQIQATGIVQVAVRGEASGDPTLPAYVEIANLRVQDAHSGYRFTAENGAETRYNDFAACIYARSVHHLVVRDSVLTNCAQGFYNWTGSGESDTWWAGRQLDTVLRGNDIHGNGIAGNYSVHQVYAESDGVIIEGNRFGPMRPGAEGSQIKDRSAGTVIRYNTIEQAPGGWDLDLVEPEEGWPTLGSRPAFRQAFVYGNVIVNRLARPTNLVHWNEDHQAGRGRATLADGKLFFYANTVVIVANEADASYLSLFNAHWGGYECPLGALPGTIDVRNNVIAVLPRTPGARTPQLRFGYCGSEGFSFGKNWVSPGWTLRGKQAVTGRGVSGVESLVSPAANDPGFVDLAANDFRLRPGASAAAIGGDLAPEVARNSLGLDLTPRQQVGAHRRLQPRTRSGAGSDIGALER